MKNGSTVLIKKKMFAAKNFTYDYQQCYKVITPFFFKFNEGNVKYGEDELNDT